MCNVYVVLNYVKVFNGPLYPVGISLGHCHWHWCRYI